MEKGKERAGEVLRSVLFLLLGVFLLAAVQKLLTPVYNWPEHTDNTNYTLEGFRALPAQCEDVIFLGTSHMDYGVSPMQLYQDYGIVSYNLATCRQPIEGSLYLLKRTFRRQSTKVVVLDVSSLFFDDHTDKNLDAGFHFILDDEPLSADKIALAMDYQKLYERMADNKEVQRNAGGYADNVFWPSVFPLLRFHQRWESLNEADFRDFFPISNYYNAGHCISSVCTPSGWTVQLVNDYAERLERAGMYRFEIPEENVRYVEEMRKLCEENGCQLLLVKIPTMGSPINDRSSWSKVRSDYIRELAQEQGWEYLDLVYDLDPGLDMATDSIDGGRHMNYRGAAKVTACLGDVLVSEYGLGGRTLERYEKNLEDWREVLALAEIQSETDLCRYLKLLQENADRYAVIFACRDDVTVGLTEEERQALADFGLTASFDESMGKYSYAAVVAGGKVAFEKASPAAVQTTFDAGGGKVFQVMSVGALYGTNVSVSLDGVEQVPRYSGLNILVYDLQEGQIADSVTFRFGEEGRPVTRIADWTNRDLRTFEYKRIRHFERFD